MLLQLNKPAGILSTDLVNFVKSKKMVRKAGHGGALDPLASGAVLIATDRDTKRLQFVLSSKKTYQFALMLGIGSLTGDLESPLWWEDSAFLTRPDMESVLNQAQEIIATWPHTYNQSVSVYSSVKVKGFTLREVAHQGQITNFSKNMLEVDYNGTNIKLPVPTKEVTIHDIHVQSAQILSMDEWKEDFQARYKSVVDTVSWWQTAWLGDRKKQVYSDITDSMKHSVGWCNQIADACNGKIPMINIEVTVSGGTYIRQLAIDIAEKLGTRGVCAAIHRLPLVTTVPLIDLRDFIV